MTALVRLEMESRPERVMLVRSMLAGIAEPLELDDELLDDMRTAVSEACNNVVQHAYGAGVGSLIVELTADETAVSVLVTDRGESIHEVAPRKGHMGIGLAVIGALSDRAEIESDPENGTELLMTFGRRAPATLEEGGAENPLAGSVPGLHGDLIGQVRPVRLLAAVLGRTTRALAAGSHFSIDRIDELRALTDAIAAHAEHAATGQVSFALEVSARRLEVTVGPFRPGTVTTLVAAQPDPPIASRPPPRYQLIAEAPAGGELLHAVLHDPRT